MSKSLSESRLRLAKDMVEEALHRFLPSQDEEPQIVHEAMRYAVLSGGKRLRPLLALAVSEFAGQPGDFILPACCSLEYVHAASLILDDLPAMDNAQSRRGVVCTHLRYGESTALLAAFGLVSLAFSVLSRTAIFTAESVRKAVNELASAMGSRGLIGGQYGDLVNKISLNSLETIESIHTDKSGALFRAAVRIPAFLLELPEPDVNRLTVFAQSMGLAFQISDDLLDIVEDAHSSHGNSHVRQLGIEGARARMEFVLKKGMDALEGYGKEADALRAFAEYVKTRSH